MGCAVAATDVGAVAEIVADGADGVLVPAGLPEEAIVARFILTIQHLAADRAALRAMGAAAASRAAALDWETCMQDFLARLDALVPGHRAGAGDRGRGDARAGLGRAMIARGLPGPARRALRRPAKLILLPGVAAPEALALPGLALWALAAARSLLHPLGAPAGGPGIPLPAAPGQVLGIVAPDAAAAAPLLGWWREAAPAAVPPVIEAASGAAALPALAARAIAALAASAEEGMAAQQGLVALRQEHEALRLCPGLAAPGRRPSPAARGAAAGRLGRALRRRAMRSRRQDGRLALGQALGVKLEGLAAIALHLKEALAGAEAVLRVRLYGAESGRIAGAWVLPGRSLAAGWPDARPAGAGRAAARDRLAGGEGRAGRLRPAGAVARRRAGGAGRCRGGRRRRGGGPGAGPWRSGPRCRGGGWCSRPIGMARRSACRRRRPAPRPSCRSRSGNPPACPKARWSGWRSAASRPGWWRRWRPASRRWWCCRRCR